jgi:acetylornithine deacetylase/succinyl-diaminopimelate desuccinylase-like protein
VEQFVEELEAGARLAPICVAGFTDSHWLREAFGTVAYGFFPMRAMSAELAARLIHAADERIPVEDVGLGVEFLRSVALSVGS